MKYVILVFIIALLALAGISSINSPTVLLICPPDQVAGFAFSESGAAYHACMNVKAVVRPEHGLNRKFNATIIVGGPGEVRVKTIRGKIIAYIG